MPDIKEFENMVMLDLPEDERELLGARLKALDKSFAQIQQVDTEAVEPLVTVLDLRNVLREDTADKLLSRDELLSSAPEQYDGYFKVPGTLD